MAFLYSVFFGRAPRQISAEILASIDGEGRSPPGSLFARPFALALACTRSASCGRPLMGSSRRGRPLRSVSQVSGISYCRKSGQVPGGEQGRSRGVRDTEGLVWGCVAVGWLAGKTGAERTPEQPDPSER